MFLNISSYCEQERFYAFETKKGEIPTLAAAVRVVAATLFFPISVYG
jgi:hypothetical protein